MNSHQQEKNVPAHRERLSDADFSRFEVKNRDIPLHGCIRGNRASEWLVRLTSAAGSQPVVLSPIAWDRIVEWAATTGFGWPATDDLTPTAAIAFAAALKKVLERETLLSEGDRAMVTSVRTLALEGRSVRVSRERRI
jgi:hypothetical protein